LIHQNQVTEPKEEINMPNDPEIHEDEMNTLLNDFESGKISRRDLFKGATALGVFTFAAEAQAQSAAIPEMVQMVMSAPGNKINNEGRKVLLERLMNHRYKERSQDGPITKLSGANGSPLRMTSVAHGLRDKDQVKFAGLEAPYSSLNGKDKEIDVIDDDNFDVVGETSNGNEYEPAMATWELWQNQVVRLLGVKGGVQHANSGSPIAIYSKKHGLTTGDIIKVNGVRGLIGANNGVNGAPEEWEVIVASGQTDSFQLKSSTGFGNHVANTGAWEETNHNMFENAVDHQKWMFAEMDGGGGTKFGLKSYSHGNAVGKKSLTEPIMKGSFKHDGKDIGNGAGPILKRLNSEATGNGLELFQKGLIIPGNEYDYEDVYGLVRLKMDWLCKHCNTSTLATVISWLMNSDVVDEEDIGKRFYEFEESEAFFLDAKKVTVRTTDGEDVTVYTREVIQSLLGDPDHFDSLKEEFSEDEHEDVDWGIVGATFTESNLDGDARSKHGDY
jgi:hypothetical protein